MGSRHRPMPHPLFTLSFLLLLSSVTAFDLSSDRAALLSLRSSVGKYIPWNLSSPSPCQWPGVTCEANRVTILRLPAAGLMGPIPSPLLSNLTALHTLSLRFNALVGPLPSDLPAMTQLRNLYLQANHFAGKIPSSLFTMTNLVRLNLADNNFTGEIPVTLNNLTRLATLYLEDNNLVGQIPDLNLPNLFQFNVSFNKLNGSIPMKLRSMTAESFLNTTLCGGPLPACPWEVSPPTSDHKKSSKLSAGAIAGIAIAAAVVFLVLLLLLILFCRRRNGAKGGPRSNDVAVAAVDKQPEAELPLTDKRVVGEGVPPPPPPTTAVPVVTENGAKRLTFFGQGPRVYDLEDLLRASAEVLGKGTFGTAYKAVLEMGTVVAVKRLKEVSITESEFREKIAVIGAMEHQNLVGLRAYYYSKDERLLVYDYMSNGSLSSLLHGKYFLLRH